MTELKPCPASQPCPKCKTNQLVNYVVCEGCETLFAGYVAIDDIIARIEALRGRSKCHCDPSCETLSDCENSRWVHEDRNEAIDEVIKELKQ